MAAFTGQPVIAHAGHWAVNLAFALPAVIFIGWLGWITIKDRRRGGGSDDAGCRLRARATGLEPATSGVTGRRSNQLNYAR